MRGHIAAAVLSIMCVCVWYIVERTQTHNSCTGEDWEAFVLGPRVCPRLLKSWNGLLMAADSRAKTSSVA